MVSNLINFEPLKWTDREIVIQTNVAPIITGNSRIIRKVQSLRTKPVRLKFRFDRELTVAADDLALALSTLCGKSFDRISFGFEVPEAISNDIAKWTESEVETSGVVDSTVRKLGGTVLNFSGGFDSLAAHFMLPEGHSMVSLDFGGRFGREQKFFREFSPIQIETNLVQTSMRKNSWSFIGLGSLLAASETRSKYCTFGSIIESTGFQRNTAHEKGFTFPPFASAGMTNAPTTQGISEVGTALVIAEHGAEFLAPSLRSLASPGEEKLYRKWVLATTALEEFGRPVPFKEVHSPERPHYEFGERFVIDLTAMMVASLGREDLASRLVRGLDQQRLSDARALDFDFMFKADRRMYKNYPDALRPALENALDRAGIHWYSAKNQNDAKEFREYWNSTSRN